ncbi:MAG: DUF1573 domain-containing protein [Saprospiraceae bacterium]
MKSIFTLLFSVFLMSSLTAQTKQNVDITFDKESLDIGIVKRGEIKTFSYQFTNTGIEDIEIEIVSGCDCTTTDWTVGIIKPGEKGTIDVVFNSTEKEASEMVDVDLYLKNLNPISDAPYLFILDYSFVLEE